MEQKLFIITKEDVNVRLDVFLEKQLQVFTRSHIKKQIENQEVFVNKKIVKAGYALKTGDEVEVLINPPKELSLKPQNLELNIVYEDENFAVINKPQGMVVHPAVGNHDKTLVNGLLYQIKDLSGINGVYRPGIVHRLDKNTSGLIVVAKNDFAHVNLSKQIETKVCKRYYLALTEGKYKTYSGEIKTYIARDPKNRLKMAVSKDGVGKFAETHYKVVKRFEKHDLVEFELKTGRTHQIRVHTAHLNRPIVGDSVYNSNGNNVSKNNILSGLKGQLLHAYKLELINPKTQKLQVFEIELPKHFVEILNKLS